MIIFVAAASAVAGVTLERVTGISHKVQKVASKVAFRTSERFDGWKERMRNETSQERQPGMGTAE